MTVECIQPLSLVGGHDLDLFFSFSISSSCTYIVASVNREGMEEAIHCVVGYVN